MRHHMLIGTFPMSIASNPTSVIFDIRWRSSVASKGSTSATSTAFNRVNSQVIELRDVITMYNPGVLGKK